MEDIDITIDRLTGENKALKNAKKILNSEMKNLKGDMDALRRESRVHKRNSKNEDKAWMERGKDPLPRSLRR